MEFDDATRQLLAVGNTIYAHGWVPATSGNLSLRLADGDIAITVSGANKGRLASGDIMRIGVDGTAKTPQKPSAETALHLQLYRRDHDIGAVLHTHSINATLVSMRMRHKIRFAGLEILKAFAGIHTHDTHIDIPVFANSQDMARLADDVERHMQEHGQGIAYTIAGHGLYTWGVSLDQCMRHLEALEYLFEYTRLNES